MLRVVGGSNPPTSTASGTSCCSLAADSENDGEARRFRRYTRTRVIDVTHQMYPDPIHSMRERTSRRVSGSWCPRQAWRRPSIWAHRHRVPRRPTRRLGRAALEHLRTRTERCGLQLCSGWVYPAGAVTRVAGALLPHRFTLTCGTEMPSAVCFQWHCPGHPGLPLTTTLLRGSGLSSAHGAR